MYLILILISFSLVLLGLIKPKSIIATFFLFFLLWILSGFNSSNPDRENYRLNFEWTKGDWDYFQFGYNTIMKIAHFFNISFEQFQLILFLIFLILLVYSIRRYTKYSAAVLSLYFIYPFFLDVVQIKTFLSMVIITYAFRFLLNPTPKNQLIYFLLILLATSVHYLSIFYFLFLFLNKFTKNQIFTYTFFFVIITTILVYSGLIGIIAEFFLPIYRVEDWFHTENRFGFVVLFVIHIIMTYLIDFAYKKIELNSFTFPDTIYIKKFGELIYKANLVMWFLFPFYAYNMIFMRVYRNMFLIFFSFFTLVFLSGQIKFKKQFRFLIVFVFLMWFYFIFITNFKNIFIIIFKENYIIT